MSMREIQDLTFDLARGADRLDALFARRAALFTEWFRHATIDRAIGIRLTAAPVSALPGAIRVAHQPGGVPIQDRFEFRFEGSERALLAVVPLHFSTPRPILRGCRAAVGQEWTAVQLDILNGGLVDLWWWRAFEPEPPAFYLGWMLGAVLLVLKISQWIRGLVGATEWEYALELQTHGLSAGLNRAAPPITHVPIRLFGDGADTIEVPVGFFPRLSWQSPEEEIQVLNLILQDVRDAAGLRQGWPRMIF
jgi:hypothetical protein